MTFTFTISAHDWYAFIITTPIVTLVGMLADRLEEEGALEK